MHHDKLLKNKLLSVFPDEIDRAKVHEILGAYGLETYEQEPARVRLAILKLGGSEITEIEKWTKCAKEDFRDILAWAEYPRQSKSWSMPDGPKKQKLIAADKQEYEQWLNT
jgi:hypothetical protein